MEQRRSPRAAGEAPRRLKRCRPVLALTEVMRMLPGSCMNRRWRLVSVELREPWRTLKVASRGLQRRRVEQGRDHWPHQVALTADFVRGRQQTILVRFCRGLSVCPR